MQYLLITWGGLCRVYVIITTKCHQITYLTQLVGLLEHSTTEGSDISHVSASALAVLKHICKCYAYTFISKTWWQDVLFKGEPALKCQKMSLKMKNSCSIN